MVHVGFIGLGGMGLHQTKAFAQVKGCRIVAGADVESGSREKFLALYPDAKTFDNHKRLLADPGVDAVVIAVPTGFHRATASDAIKAGKPVLLEKPMARTVADCRRLNELADRTDTLLMIAQCRRYDAHWESWGKYVTDGKLGSLVLWRSIMAGIGPGRWYMDDKIGGGPLLDGAIHNYDFAQLLFGDPESVVSSAIKMDPAVTAVDTCSAVVRYKSGHQLLMSWSWSAIGLSMSDVVGPKGFIQFGTGGLTPPESDGTGNDYCCFTDTAGKQRLLKARSEPSMYVRQAEHFRDCVQGKTECRTPGTEAIKAVAVAEAILIAGRAGKAMPVRW